LHSVYYSTFRSSAAVQTAIRMSVGKALTASANSLDSCCSEDATNTTLPLTTNAMRYTETIPRKVKVLSLADECSRGTRPSKMYSDQGNINVMRNGSEYMKKRVGIYRYGAPSQAITCNTT